MQTVTVQHTIAAPIEQVFDWLADTNNYRQIPLVRTAEVTRTSPDGGQGVGAVRVVTTWAGAKYTEEITRYERPYRWDYRVRSSIPPMRHEGVRMKLRATNEGTEVTWTSTFEVRAPALRGPLTQMLAPVTAFGLRMILWTADRKLTNH